MGFSWLVVPVLAAAAAAEPPVPQTVEQSYADFDPRRDPLETRVVREWEEDGLVLRYVVFTVGGFKGVKARLAAFYGFPKDAAAGRKLPALLHMHGGGQRAFLREVRQFAGRGYAVLSVNWGGREMETARPGEENTDWGAVDPTQTNVAGYSNLPPGPKTVDAAESPRNNNWYLLCLGCRRGITFLEQQPEVDPDRIGAYGHSMGGRLAGLVAGSDPRVKAASPSVGGSGFLQTDLWGLPGSARRVAGGIELFRRTIAGQAYLERVRCLVLFLTAANDFNAPLDFVVRGLAGMKADRRLTVAPHLNHRFTPETEIARALWFDSHLQKRLAFPSSPVLEWVDGRADGVPVVRVRADRSRPIERVDLWYGYERDPRNRFWADAGAEPRGDAWEGACPVFDLGEPLFVLANVHYRLAGSERRPGDPATFVLSAATARYPGALKQAGVAATERPRRLIDDFSRGFHDWYTLNADNRHHWFFSTRKPADPRWEAPRGAVLSLTLETDAPDNTLAVQLQTDAWRGHSGRKAATYTARVALPKAGRQTVEVKLSDFASESGTPPADWAGITELILRAADKALPGDKTLSPWKGGVPRMIELRWVGGEPVRRPKPYPAAGASGTSAGAEDPEFQKAIEESIRRERMDGKRP